MKMRVKISWVLVLVATVIGVWGWTRAIMDEVHAVLARGRTDIMREARDGALVATNVQDVVSTLRFLGQFYAGSEASKSGIERHHAFLMNEVRAGYQRDIIRRLVVLTGTDLGRDPSAWIAHYGKTE